MELTGAVGVKAGTTGVSAGAATVAVIAFSYFWRGAANSAAGVKAMAADSSEVPKAYLVPTEPLTDIVDPPIGAVTFEEGYWFEFNYTLGRNTEIPAKASRQRATTSFHSTLPHPPARLFIQTFSTKALTWSSNLCTKA